ncbi:MAG: heavy-metal-associated domain-containing protein [Lachnospiraceae bacterium]|nr:heavy-metal-associated domain-containing protein [Lachnospiraceae bacterium]
MVKMLLKIEGMSCGMCESHINDTIRRQFDVKKVTSSHSKGRTEIIAETPPDEEALRNAIGETGYMVVSIETKNYEKRGLFRR